MCAASSAFSSSPFSLGGSAMKMRILAPALSAMAAMVLGLAGCNRESNKGGPGADKANKGTTTSTSNDRAESFSIKVPAGHTNVTQGEQTEINVSVSRGNNFDQDVKL